MHKAQIIAVLTIAFLAGIFIGSFVANPNRFLVILLIVGGLLFVAIGYFDRVWGLLVGGCIIFAAIGIYRFSTVNLTYDILSTFAGVEAGGKGVPVTLMGYIDQEPSLTTTGNVSLTFKAKQLILPGKILNIDERTLITAKAGSDYKFGQKLSIAGPLNKPDNFAPDFDYISYLKNKSIRTTMQFPKIQTADISLNWAENIKINLYTKLFAIKNRFEQSVSTVMPEPYSSYINGVLLGSRQNIPQNLQDAFNKTGTTHILAISGYNITVIAEALLAALVFFVRRRAAFWLSVIFIILFTILTGAGASVVRAAVMGLLLLSANGYGRLYDARNSILLAGAAMVWLNPMSLRFDVGFQLSFLAVIGLMYLFPIFEHIFRKIKFRNEVAKELKDTLLMTVSAQLMVAPLLIYYFKQFSLVSLPANLLVLPLMPFTMLFGFLAGLGGLIFWPLGKALGVIALIISGYQLEVIKWLGTLSWSAINLSIKPFTLWVLYIIILGLIWNFRTKLKTHEI